jgi:RNA polymerase sigma-70 factor (ECF subfamily)
MAVPVPPDAGLTSSSLLLRLQNREEDAWRELLRVYGRLVFYWCHRAGLREPDAQDVMQEVFLLVAQRIGQFAKRYERGSFRSWLRHITRFKILEHSKRANDPKARGGSSAQEWLAQLPAEATDDTADAEAETERSILLRSALEAVRDEFTPPTFRAALAVLREDRKPAEVAAELGLTPNAVYVAKFRVLRRLRDLLAALPP